MKKRPVSNDDFFEGFFQWLDSEKGQTSMEAMEAVAAALKGAHVDTRKRRIVWPDGKRLTIDQSAQRIQKQSGEDLKAIKSHVVGWLEMDFEPKGPNEKQMEIFQRMFTLTTDRLRNHNISNFIPVFVFRLVSSL